MRTLVQGEVLEPSTTAMIDSRPIASGIVHPQAVGPMWQGLPVQEFLPPKSFGPVGSALMPATSLATITGFTVANDAMMAPLGSRVPQAWPATVNAPGPPSINFVRLGSGVRFVVAISSTYAAALLLQGAPANTPLAWDFSTQRLIAGSPVAQLPVTLAGVSLLSGRTICVDPDGTVRWNPLSAVAVIVV
jgi:hypothetical protein